MQRNKPETPAIGAPSRRDDTRCGYWRHARIQRRKRILLPGAVIDTELGSIATAIGSTVVENADGQQLAVQFRQTGKPGNDRISQAIAAYALDGRIEHFAILVDADVPFGKSLPTLKSKPKSPPRRFGRVGISAVIKVAGRRRPITTEAMPAAMYGQLLHTAVRTRKVPAPTPLLLPTFWPEDWCFNPICHPHWTWFPGVPATTSCHGGCIWWSCKCPISGVNPPATGKICSGITLCWCQ